MYNSKRQRNGIPQRKLPTFEVAKPTKLLDFLTEKLHGASKTTAKSYCSLKFVRVDDRIETRPHLELTPGQVVTIDKETRKSSFRHQMLDIVYEDQHIIVINKKEGLLSVSATESIREQTAQRIIQDYVKRKDKRNRIFVVHRLDRETSGLMMFVKSEEMQRFMRDHWKEIVFERNYIAVVEGRMKKEYDTIRSWMKEGPDRLLHSSDKPGEGQEAITHYKVLKRGQNNSLVDVHLDTGRKNQIRVHMQDIGHPIIGDWKYGNPDLDPIGRLCLHARVLSFYHPVTEKPLRFETPVPKKFLSLLK